jgi:hypothetical protein
MWQSDALAVLESAAMARGAVSVREMAAGTCVHPAPTDQDSLADLLPPTPAAPRPLDVLHVITAALDCFDHVLATAPTRPAFPRPVLDQLITRAEATLTSGG